MLSRQDEAAIQTDAYIDALLVAHAASTSRLAKPVLLPPPALRQAIQLLENGLPRIHPSFRFEQQLSARLRHAALAQLAGRPVAELDDEEGAVVELPGAILAGSPEPSSAGVDRRLLLSGAAIASGVSLAGAVIAWRRLNPGRTSTRRAARRRLLA